jgi:hypothetical protein
LGKWKRLEELTARVSRFRLKNLSGEEVREFGQLYRRTAADLAIAREEVCDQRLVNYLNYLAGALTEQFTGASRQGLCVFVWFFRYEFPAVFRKTFRYTLTALRPLCLRRFASAASSSMRDLPIVSRPE